MIYKDAIRMSGHLKIVTLLLLILPLALSACGTKSGEAKYPSGLERSTTGDDIYGERQSIFGKGGFKMLGGKEKKDDSGSSGIGVNSFLWRASLDTVSFLPISSADPFGGVILTDWYTPAESPAERFKVNVFILDRQLRSDGVQVKLFRQVLDNGQWVDTKPSEETAHKLEDTILTRARQMRVAQMQVKEE